MAAPKTKKIAIWEVTEKCYFNGELYLVGDTVEDGDFSDHPCFKKVGEKEVEATEATGNVDIPPADAGSN